METSRREVAFSEPGVWMVRAGHVKLAENPSGAGNRMAARPSRLARPRPPLPGRAYRRCAVATPVGGGVGGRAKWGGTAGS